jgi:hypothetical protein
MTRLRRQTNQAEGNHNSTMLPIFTRTFSTASVNAMPDRLHSHRREGAVGVEKAMVEMTDKTGGA